MLQVHTEIEIAASPEQVRNIFLDFAKFPQWQDHFTSVISPKTGKDLVKGDKLKITMPGMGTFTATVGNNSSEEFVWTGSLPYIFTGEHTFRFEPSKTIEGGTHFVDAEKFTGLLTTGMSRFVSNEKGNANFERFNRALKKKVEESPAQ